MYHSIRVINSNKKIFNKAVNEEISEIHRSLQNLQSLKGIAQNQLKEAEKKIYNLESKKISRKHKHLKERYLEKGADLSSYHVGRISEYENDYEKPLSYEQNEFHKAEKERYQRKVDKYEELTKISQWGEKTNANINKAKQYREKKDYHEYQLNRNTKNKETIEARKIVMKDDKKLDKSNKKKHKALQLEFNLKSAYKVKAEALKFLNSFEILEENQKGLISNVLLECFNKKLDLYLELLNDRIGGIVHSKTMSRKLID